MGWGTTPAALAQQQADKNCMGGWESIAGRKQDMEGGIKGKGERQMKGGSM
jgi:hypothetical protein